MDHPGYLVLGVHVNQLNQRLSQKRRQLKNMPIPQEVKDAYAEKDGFIIFTTVDKAGVPNSG